MGKLRSHRAELELDLTALELGLTDEDAVAEYLEVISGANERRPRRPKINGESTPSSEDSGDLADDVSDGDWDGEDWEGDPSDDY
ncbi:MAG: hypothetical protein QNJ40_25625 [Xanthomonadales bacterium]|nr:hypothetical protein [Xanthomonadales bacterium]